MRFQPQFLSWKVKQAKLGLPILLHHPNPALRSPVRVISDVFDYINAHYLENISLADIAESFF